MRLRAGVAGLGAVALVILGPVAATAEGQPDPIEPLQDLVGEVESGVVGSGPPASSGSKTGTPLDTVAPEPPGGGSDGTGSGAPQLSELAPTAPTSEAAAPSESAGSSGASDSDAGGHETEDPEPPDHAEGHAVDLDVADEDAVDLAHDRATVEDDDDTTADSTLLALGGQEVIGAHADSDADSAGESQAHGGAGEPLTPLCEESDGQVCLSLLYADASATEDGNTSRTRSQSGAADVCLGGSDTDRTKECDGPIEAGVLASDAEAERDQRSGRTTASSGSDVAHVCVQEDPATGACVLGAEAAHSEGRSDSGGGQPSASRDSSFLGVDAGGRELLALEDPLTAGVQPECADPSLICTFVNQGETYVGDNVAGHAQKALDVEVLPGILPGIGSLIDLELADTESLVHNDGGEPAPITGGSGDPSEPELPVGGGPGHPGGTESAAAGVWSSGGAGVLPDTGGIWSGLLALGLLSVAGGAFLLVRNRVLDALA